MCVCVCVDDNDLTLDRDESHGLRLPFELSFRVWVRLKN